MFAVYRLRDAEGRALYIGFSRHLGARFDGHRVQPYWSQVARIDVTHHETKIDAETEERRAIAAERPPHNRLVTEVVPRVKYAPHVAQGRKIRALREQRGISMTEFAHLCGLHYTHLSRIETGERKGTPAQLVAIARELQVPLTAVAVMDDAEAVAS